MAQSFPDLPLTLPVIAPTEDEWRAMSPSAREALLVRINDALSDPVTTMTEGRRHKKAKTRTIDALNLHFGAIGRAVYLAEEMAVLYPGKPVFTPDVLAVVGVEEPEDDTRADEAQAQAEVALTALRDGIVALLHARGITCSEAARARLSSCAEATTLQRWLVRATSAATEDEVFTD